MSLAIIVQREANTVQGGTIDGIRVTTTSTASANVMYGRRLTDMLINEAFSLGNNTVQTFTASVGATNSTSTPGTFVLASGTYRVSVDALYDLNNSNDNVIIGLFNVTANAFEIYDTDSSPILGTTIYGNKVLNANSRITEAAFTVSGNTTYQINHACNGTNISGDSGRQLFFCGKNTSITAAIVNGAAPMNTYCMVKILKVT